LRAQAAELLACRLRAPPRLHDLRAPASSLPQRELALDARVVEQPQRVMHRRRRRRVAEAVRDEDAPMPIVMRVRPRVARHEVERSFHVARLVGDTQVELEIRPVLGLGVEHPVEVVREAHRAQA
jgi:hypothetical protein